MNKNQLTDDLTSKIKAKEIKIKQYLQIFYFN